MTETIRGEEVPTDGRDRRWDDHRQARREHLLETAIALIDREGIGVGVAAIASAAEVPRSVVYKLFRDREDLDEQIRQRLVAQVSTAILATLKSRGSIRTLVAGAIDSYVSWVVAHPNLHRFLGAGSTSAPVKNTATSIDATQSFAITVQELVETAWVQLQPSAPLPAGAAQHLTYGSVGLVDSVVNPWLLSKRGAKTSKAALVAFLTDAVTSLIGAAGRMAGTAIDVDVVIRLA